MADNLKFIQAQAFTLAGAGCVIGDTTIILNSFKQIDGTQLTMTDFGSMGFLTIEPDNNTQEEQIVFTGCVVNANGTTSLTGVSHVLFVSPYTQTSGVNTSHPGGVKVIISNTSGFYDQLTSKADDETITGVYTFTQSPVIPTGGTGTQAANATDIANAITGASGTATTTTSGTVKLSTAALVGTNPIVVGDNDTRVPTADHNAALAGTSGTAVSAANKLVDNADSRLFNMGVFGDGSDGDVVVSVNGSISRDMYYHNLTINNGIVLSSAGYKIYVSGTLTQVGTGLIDNSGGAGGTGGAGGNASASTGGTAGTAGGAGGGGAGNSLPAGKAGVAGGAGGAGKNGATGGNGVAGNAGGNTAASILNGTPTSVNNAGNGGAGGSGGGQAGGGSGSGTNSGGSIVSSNTQLNKTTSILQNFSAWVSGTLKQLEYNAGNCSGGGGGGGGNQGGATGSSGGGGGGGGSGGNGGVVAVFANAIVTANNPLASSVGGAGGNGGTGGNYFAGTGDSSGGSGGGGGGTGGNGGLVFIAYKTLTGALTATVTGGAAGTFGAKGASYNDQTGSVGTAGNAGTVGLLVTATL